MSHRLSRIGHQMNQSLALRSNMKIGETIRHPDGRKVKIKSGQFLDPTFGLVSNWWTWNEVLPDGKLGPDEKGYGW